LNKWLTIPEAELRVGISSEFPIGPTQCGLIVSVQHYLAVNVEYYGGIFERMLLVVWSRECEWCCA